MIKAGYMNKQHIHFYWRFKVLLIFLVLCWGGKQPLRAQYYPIHATVQWPSPQSPYLSDYYSGSRDRLIVNLLNRDLQQPLLFARLRIKIKSTGFLATSREEISYPMLELSANVPTRLTNIDLSPYLQPQNLQINGRLHNGQLPTGYTEFSVQVVDYYTGRTLSAWHTGRSYLDVKKPPILNFPEKDARIGVTEPLYLRFQWMPRHQGLAGTEYEFVLKELPNNGAAPQSAFAYGNEIYRVRTRNTTLNYTHLDPVLFPNRCYAWQVQAIARDGVDEVGMFENGGYSEINWFYLTDDCQAPTGLRAHPRFAKVDLSWNKVIGTTGYIVECRPKTKSNTYEWSRTQIAGEHLTLAQLKLGWTYEWRVGTLCTDDHPVFSGVSEFTLSKQNDELLADCGKEPVRKDLSQEPNLRIKAGDIVTIGGDYPMTITEVVPLGDGWYSGRGKTRLKTIIDAPVALRFDRLRINVDNFQIDGTVEASYDEKKGKIANLDYVDDGGKDVKPATIRMREHKLDFTLPDIPQFTYNPETGEIETTDVDGTPHTIKIDVPENGSYERVFPMLVTDSKGNSYQVSAAEHSTEEEAGDNVGSDSKKKRIQLTCERVDRVGDFNPESLSRKYGYIEFDRGEGKYAFDNGQEKWYKKSVKVDRFYKPVAKGYIAPWKLVPVGENDVVTAKYEGSKNIDLKKVRFASEPNTAALPAKFNEAEQTWTISLRSVSPGASYDVFAVYEGVAIGKLRVVSYAKQQHKVTLVPINKVRLDKAAIEQELNAIYNPVGVQFTVNVDESMRDNYSWEVDSEKDGLLSTVGKSFWGYDKELKETPEMLNLQKTYQQEAGTLDGVYLFVLNGAKGLEGQNKDLLGEMPRKSRFGYIFTANSYNTTSLVRTIAHEVGHGIFTLQHTFDAEYGKGTQGETNNLLDYTAMGKELAAFQWNVMANPAVFTMFDKSEKVNLTEKVAMVSGCNLGISPSGQLIYRVNTPVRDGTIVKIIHIGSNRIWGYVLYGGDGKLIDNYSWNNNVKDYVNQNGVKAGDSKAKNIKIFYNTTSEPSEVIIYKYQGDGCVYAYATATCTSNPITGEVHLLNQSEWKTEILWNADVSCRSAYTGKQVKLCPDEKLKSDSISLSSLSNKTDIKIVNEVIDSVCITSLRTLPYNRIIDLIEIIVSSKNIKEPSERSILRLLSCIKGQDYSTFFVKLEENEASLLKKLIAGMDDVRILPWEGRNYTRFIDILVSMYLETPKFYSSRIESQSSVLVLNLEPIRLSETMAGYTQYVYKGELTDEGKVDIKRRTEHISYVRNIITSNQQDEIVTKLLPFSPILLLPKDLEIDLIGEALGGQLKDSTYYIVPAVFLQYYNDKLFNDKVEKNSLLAVDIATIALSGGTALATKVHWARRLWAMAEVAGAVGNIAINTQMISSPRVKEVVEIYNAAMGLIGLKNLGQGGYKFVKELPESLNQSFKNQLVSKYLDYRIAITKLKNSNDWAELSAEVRQNVIKQEKSFIAFADAKNLPNDKWGAPDDIFINGKTKQDILSIRKGERPAPETYLKTRYIKEHLAKFEGEVSCLSFEKSVNTYGQIGRDDGLFIMPKIEMDKLLQRTGKNISQIENELGIPEGSWSSKLHQGDKLIRVDIKINTHSKLRIPSGNEIGADELLWIPGGKTLGGFSEAIIEPIKVKNTNIYTTQIIIQ